MKFERDIEKQKVWIFDECFTKSDFINDEALEHSNFLSKAQAQYETLSQCLVEIHNKRSHNLPDLESDVTVDKETYKKIIEGIISKKCIKEDNTKTTVSSLLSLFPPMVYCEALSEEVDKHFEYLKDLDAFLRQWFDSSSCIEVSTSGSTGTPKKMLVEKERMMNSATTTLSFLGLHQGDKAHLCMPLKYIAGKMIVVRSLVLGMKIIATAPSSHPLKNFEKQYIPNFSAMVPLQVLGSLENAAEKSLLQMIDHLIIGGGAVNDDVALVLSDFPRSVWSTYGMTETLSHIALKRLSGKDASHWYSKFTGVTLTTSDEGTLIIDAPHVCSEKLVTNDIVEFNELGQFRILGRKDNTVNTGGVKVQIEEVERLINEALRNRPAIMPAYNGNVLNQDGGDEKAEQSITKFESPIVGSFDYAITAVPDDKYGEKLVMLIALTGEDNLGDYERIEYMMHQCFDGLPKYHAPKAIFKVDTIPHTETGKIDRANCKRVAASCL